MCELADEPIVEEMEAILDRALAYRKDQTTLMRWLAGATLVGAASIGLALTETDTYNGGQERQEMFATAGFMSSVMASGVALIAAGNKYLHDRSFQENNV